MCEAILKVYEEGLVKPLKMAMYQQREKTNDTKEEEEEEEKEQQKAGDETEATEEGEATVVELLEGGLDEEDDDDDDEEVEVLDVGEVTEEEEEEVEEPSVASATSVTSETSANPDPDPANPWRGTGESPGVTRKRPGEGWRREQKHCCTLCWQKWKKKTNTWTNVKIFDKLDLKKEIQLCWIGTIRGIWMFRVKKVYKEWKIKVWVNKMWMGNCCSAISMKGKGFPSGWKASMPDPPKTPTPEGWPCPLQSESARRTCLF